MSTTQPLIRPALHLGLLQPGWPLFQAIAEGMSNLGAANAGDLLGYALGHGTGARYSDGGVSEYLCAFVGTGDRRSIDGAVLQLQPAARAVIGKLDAYALLSGTIARAFRKALGGTGPEFETIHFKNFTAAILYDDTASRRDVSEILLFVDPAQSALDAAQRVAEIEALFRFLSACHDTLSRYRFDLPTPDQLNRAA
jgi:hypothetical protein